MDIDRGIYAVNNIDMVDSPALLVYRDKVEANIQKMIEMAGSAEALIPHVKTHKMAAVIQMYLEAGIKKFKAATIAEAEMAATGGAEEVVLAYQPVGPKIGRFIRLIDNFSWVKFAALVDDEGIVDQIQAAAKKAETPVRLLIDINGGFGRTGILPGEKAKALYRKIQASSMLEVVGIHAYDGHVRNEGLENRQAQSDKELAAVLAFKAELEAEGLPVERFITAGSPSFPTHLNRDGVELSPGTTIFWDANYGSKFSEMPFEPAALVLSRVISKPAPGRLCLDLGHKSIASENPPDKRVRFLGVPINEVITHSEEHFVIATDKADEFKVGDVLYGIPWHICPTVALHQEGIVVDAGMALGSWPVTARDRRIKI